MLGSVALDPANASKLAAELNRRGLDAGLDGPLLHERVEKRVSNLQKLRAVDAPAPKTTAKARNRQTGRAQNPFHDFVTNEIRNLGDKIKIVPSSIEKSRCALKALLTTREWVLNDELLDAVVLMRSEIGGDLIQDVIADWTRDRNTHKQKDVPGSIFWYPPDGKFVEWGVSRYRFAEHFDVGGFEDAFSDFERGLSGAPSEDVGSYGIRSLCFDLLMISRSSKLTLRLSDEIEIALKRVYESASGDTWGEAQVRPGRAYKVVPSVTTTAFCCLAMLRVSTSDSQKKLAVSAAKWLLQQQTIEGAWCTDFEVKSQLQSLAHLRDEIIHKAADVTEASVRPLIEVAWQFASKYSREVLKVDLLY